MARARAVLKSLFLVLVAVAALAALFFAVRWGWRTWRTFGGTLVPWWRHTLADPILRLLIWVWALAKGNVLLFLAEISVATWLLKEIFFGMVLSWSAAMSSRQMYTAMESAAADVEDVHGRLRNLFADDVEKIAFYESRLGARGRGISATRSQLRGCGGCLFGILWTLLTTSISLMFNVAVFDGVLRLLGNYGDRQVLASYAGPLASLLKSVPPPTHYLGLALQERSLLLTLLVVSTGLLGWLVSNISKTGWTLPTVKPESLWLAVVAPAVLMYFILNGLLLLWALVAAVVWIFGAFWIRGRRGLHLRLRAAVLQWRRRQEADTHGDGSRA